MRIETPVFLIFENNISPERIDRLKKSGCVPVCIDGDNVVFRLEAKIEYKEY